MATKQDEEFFKICHYSSVAKDYSQLSKEDLVKVVEKLESRKMSLNRLYENTG